MNGLRWLFGLTLVGLLSACDPSGTPTTPDALPSPQLARLPAQATVAINVLLDRPVSSAILDELGRLGTVAGRIDEIRAVLLRARSSDLAAIRSLSFVAAAGLDAERAAGPPLPPVPLSDFSGGLNMWNLDAVDVTDLGIGRTISGDGEGVYVGVLDSGLLDSWPFYFPAERIAEEYARSFTGGGALSRGKVASQPNKWEHDTVGHGTHVTSTILGFNVNGIPINGVAPRATVIPVKVLNNNGGGWASTIAQGIVYVTGLKLGPLNGSPVVINMSLGGSQLDAVEQAAIDYAIEQGVILVASAGNRGEAGMGYPGAYAPVISAGAAGWAGEWTTGSWFVSGNVADPTDPFDFYVTDFSSRELPGQDLDVVAPGSWVLGPFQLDLGRTSYFFLGGTSMASPHVAGTVALMAQADPGLTAAEAETILESTALPITHTSLDVFSPAGPGGPVLTPTWGADATGSGLLSAAAALGAVTP